MVQINVTRQQPSTRSNSNSPMTFLPLVFIPANIGKYLSLKEERKKERNQGEKNGEGVSFIPFVLTSTYSKYLPYSLSLFPLLTRGLFGTFFIRRSLQLPRLLRLSVRLAIYAVIHPSTDLHALFILSPYKRGYNDNNNDD